MIRRIFPLCTAAAAVAALPAVGQEAPPDRFEGLARPAVMFELAPAPGPVPIQKWDTVPPENLVTGSVIGGAIGATAGFFAAGALVRAGVQLDPTPGDDPGLLVLILGYQVGGAGGAALGSHIGNRGRGHLGLSTLGSAAVTAATATIAGTIEDWRIFLFAPVAGIIAAPIIEAITTPD